MLALERVFHYFNLRSVLSIEAAVSGYKEIELIVTVVIIMSADGFGKEGTGYVQLQSEQSAC